MRFYRGAVPEDPNFDPLGEGWRDIREPGPMLLQVLAIPVALVTLIALWITVTLISPDLYQRMGNGVILKFGIPAGYTLGAGLLYLLGILFVYLIGIALIVLVHEALHALAMPGSGLTDRTLIAVWPEKLLFYAHHIDPMPRNQFLWVFITPILGLTVLPILLIAVLTQFLGTAEIQYWLALVAIFNGLAACGDIIGFWLVLFQIPSHAQVRNQGWKSYWRTA